MVTVSCAPNGGIDLEVVLDIVAFVMWLPKFSVLKKSKVVGANGF